ncbi:MAG: hypothetical protein WDM89_22420 [Rhizomicrobium sp.]
MSASFLRDAGVLLAAQTIVERNSLYREVFLDAVVQRREYFVSSHAEDDLDSDKHMGRHGALAKFVLTDGVCCQPDQFAKLGLP